MTYSEFLRSKRIEDMPTGFEPDEWLFPDSLFDFQHDCISWGCRRGRAAFFEDCGLGKTVQQLVWAEQVYAHTNGNVLIVAPLSVSKQTEDEGKKFGINARVVSEQSDVQSGISIKNCITSTLADSKPSRWMKVPS